MVLWVANPVSTENVVSGSVEMVVKITNRDFIHFLFVKESFAIP